MAEVVVEPVQTGRQWQQFLALPWQLHAQDPHWTPPLRLTQEELVGYRKHAFYEHADRQAYLATRDGKPVGRILAVIDHEHNKRHQESRGFVGFFESIQDAAVSRKLFDAAREYHMACEQTAMRGPVNPAMNYECGLLVDGFGQPATFLMTYNPAHYVGLWEDYGWQKAQDLFAYRANTSMLHLLDGKISRVMNQAKEMFNIKTRTMNPRKFPEEVASFLHLYNSALVATWGFVPLTEGEVRDFAQTLRYLLVPELTSLAEVDGKVVAVALGIPDLNPLIKKINGRLFPFGFLQLLLGIRKLKRTRLVSTNVLPEYQRFGVGLVVLAEILPHALKMGIEEAEFSWVLETNDLSRKTIEKGGAVRTNTYRIYDYPFPAAVPAT